MCHYITIISDASDEASLNEVFARHGFSGYKMANISIQAQLKAGERQYRTGNSCDCGTVLGRMPSPSADQNLTKIVERKRKSGWSKAKIERWLSDRKRAAARPDAHADSHEAWASLLRDMLSIDSASTAGVIVHFYNGGLEAEEFALTRREIRLSEDVVAALEQMREDELLVLKRARQESAIP